MTATANALTDLASLPPHTAAQYLPRTFFTGVVARRNALGIRSSWLLPHLRPKAPPLKKLAGRMWRKAPISTLRAALTSEWLPHRTATKGSAGSALTNNKNKDH